MLGRVSGYIVAALVALSILIASGRVEAQEVPSVVAVDLDKTTVYRGYQWIEVTAYVYIPPGGSVISLSGTANLSAGIATTTPLAWISLTAPVTKTVGNITYTIRNLLIARISIPFGAVAGRGELAVSISLAARVGNTTYTPSYLYRFPVTIVDHTPVESARIEAQIRLENARTTLSLLETIGGAPMPALRAALDNLTSMFDRADVLLYQEGDVPRALAMYGSIASESTGISSQAIAIFIARQRESSLALERRLVNIETNVSASISRISALERSVASAADAIRTSEVSIRSLASALANYSSAINTYLSTLDRSVVDTNKKIDSLAQTINSAIANMSSSFNSRLDGLSSAISTVQLALVIVAVVLLASIAILGLVRRR